MFRQRCGPQMSESFALTPISWKKYSFPKRSPNRFTISPARARLPVLKFVGCDCARRLTAKSQWL